MEIKREEHQRNSSLSRLMVLRILALVISITILLLILITIFM